MKEQEEAASYFLIDMDNREFYLLTLGTSETEFTSEEIDKMLDKIYTPVSESNYFEACQKFLSLAAKYSGVRIFTAGTLLLYLLIAMGLAAVLVFVMVISNGGKQQAVSRSTYLGARVHIKQQYDKFTHTTVVRVPRPKANNNSGRGGGGFSGGGGGSNFGGGGRRF